MRNTCLPEYYVPNVSLLPNAVKKIYNRQTYKKYKASLEIHKTGNQKGFNMKLLKKLQT